MNLDSARAFIRLTRLKKDAEDNAKALGKQIHKLGQDLEMDMALEGVRNLPLEVDGKESTIYCWSQQQPVMKEGVDREMITLALEANGVDLVKPTYNANSFGSWVREQVSDGQELPQWLGQLVEVKTISRPRMRS